MKRVVNTLDKLRWGKRAYSVLVLNAVAAIDGKLEAVGDMGGAGAGFWALRLNIPANLAVDERRAAGERKAIFFFRSTLTYQEAAGRPARFDLTGRSALAFTPPVVLFIALPETEKTDPG
jgi:hypothetical protein